MPVLLQFQTHLLRGEGVISYTERWFAVPGYEGRYSASDFGRVRREYLGRNEGASLVLSPWVHMVHGKNRPQVSLSAASRKRKFAVATLVALAFHGPRPDGHQINHIDGMPAHDWASNLEYVTPQENADHAKRHRLWAYGKRNGAHTHPERIPRTSRPQAPKPCSVCRQLAKPLRRGMCGRCYERERYQRDPAAAKERVYATRARRLLFVEVRA